VRPSDENQAASSHPHLRPNLMSSSRRSGHEDSILAKLDREPTRRGGARTGPRLTWYGGAVAMALALTATLAWLAADSGSQALEAVQVSQTRSTPAGTGISTPPQPTSEEILKLSPAHNSKAALIVDTAPDPTPPLRTLDGPASAAAVVRAAPTIAAPPAAPARVAAAPTREAKADAGPSARVAVRAELRPASTRARSTPARAPARQAARAARTVNPTRSGEHDDSDVALISAVIFHVNGHAGGDGNAENTSSCPDQACRARPTRQ
jgi:hypothetical protein